MGGPGLKGAGPLFFKVIVHVPEGEKSSEDRIAATVNLTGIVKNYLYIAKNGLALARGTSQAVRIINHNIISSVPSLQG